MSEKEYFKTLEEYDKEVNKLFQENKKLKERIDKAIEYMDRRDLEWGSEEHEKMMKILKGEEVKVITDIDGNVEVSVKGE